MKNFGFVFLVVIAVGLISLQQASADKNGNKGFGSGNCARGAGSERTLTIDAEDQKKFYAFLEDTKEMRKALADRQLENQALMQSDNPDPAKAALLSNEIFDLRDQLLDRAGEAGIKTNFGGPGGGCGGRGCGVACAGPGKGQKPEQQ
jgi:hypothetical protein